MVTLPSTCSLIITLHFLRAYVIMEFVFRSKHARISFLCGSGITQKMFGIKELISSLIDVGIVIETGIDLHLESEIMKADLEKKTVTTSTGEVYQYGTLLVATGSTVSLYFNFFSMLTFKGLRGLIWATR